jgi:hypothetical protein
MNEKEPFKPEIENEKSIFVGEAYIDITRFYEISFSGVPDIILEYEKKLNNERDPKKRKVNITTKQWHNHIFTHFQK